ncbi:MAG TPA: DUF4097 family beta strand repeat-containing protein [Candidatus Heimdallarchaeota archaeon]|nr:DUF4097 family beta strand repeat-containing protein [Candidatus Heimdallarchaeota archaeon]
MKKYQHMAIIFVFLLLAGTLAFTQEGKIDRTTVPFSNPSKPGFIEASVYNGSVIIRGYEGKEVIIEAKLREKLVSEEKEEEENEKARGMKRILGSTGTGLEVEEEENVMDISVSSMKQTVDLTIQVPFNTSMEVGSYNNGEVQIENVTGEIEANNYNGKVTLRGISGSVVAHTYNGEVIVSFKQITPDKPMSFSTWNGDVDVTFPATVKADVKMKSEMGDVYSDFDIQVKQAPQKAVEDEREEGGGYKISFEKAVYGSINGGGPEFQFKTYHGDIFIRKAK